MAHKPRNKLIDSLQYLALRISAMCVQMVSIDAALSFGRLLGDLAYWLSSRHRTRALENLRSAYGPNVSDRWLQRTARQSFRHFGMLAMEVVYAPRLLKLDTAFHHIRLKDIASNLHLLTQNRPVIIVTGHYGNWELASFFLAAIGFTSYSVARHLSNPYVHDYIFGVRAKSGQQIITKKGATTSVADVLEDNQIVCFLADQDAGSRGLFIDFFGRPASTFRSIALLARAYNAPIAVGAATRLSSKFRYEFSIEQVIYPQQWQGRSDEVAWITATYTKAIERVARRCPQQYLWLHRRWKSKPRPRSVT